MAYPIVASDRDNAAVGRSLAASVAGVALVVGLTVARHVIGVPVPITEPPAPAKPAPTEVGEPAPAKAGVVPGNGGHPGGHRLLISADAHGSCFIKASVNGAMFNHMLLDSGANGHLVFGRNHAARLGFDPDTLSYDETYGSANGDGHAAMVRIREFRIGDFVLHDVPAEISEAAVFAPLIGVGILQRLGLWLRDGRCELHLP